MNSRAIIYSMKRKRRKSEKKTLQPASHASTYRLKKKKQPIQYAYSANRRRLMFIDITIIFAKQCITNWKSLDIFSHFAQLSAVDFGVSFTAHISCKINSFFILFVVFFVSSFVLYEKFANDRWKNAWNRTVCRAPHWIDAKKKSEKLP